MEMQTHRTDVWTQSGGDGGADGERSEETYASPYVKQTVSGNLLCDSGSSDWGSVTS